MEKKSGIVVRELTQLNEFADVVRVQQEIWGFEDLELLPLRLFVVANKIGGQVLGAYDGGNMAAFCLCIPGLKPGGKPYLHSHMLGVRKEYRNEGLGRKMKLQQREYALASGVDVIEWTFDPLEIKNAFFNIERLGAVVRRFVPNQYGTTTSRLHGGLPTDRLVAEWWIRTPRVEAICGGTPFARPGHMASIAVPANIGELRETGAPQTREIQSHIGESFDTYFRQGMAVIGFDSTKDSGTYLLGEWESK